MLLMYLRGVVKRQKLQVGIQVSRDLLSLRLAAPGRMYDDLRVDLRAVQIRPGRERGETWQDETVLHRRESFESSETGGRWFDEVLGHLKQLVRIDLLRCGRLAKGYGPNTEKREQWEFHCTPPS
jgi:hypothetical protein